MTTTNRPVAVVTGGNRGIGLEVCAQLAVLGFDVVLAARNAERGTAAAAALPDTVTARQLDVSDRDSVDAAARWIRQRYGRCDALVNNTATDYDTDARAVSADLDRIRRRWKRTCSAPGT